MNTSLKKNTPIYKTPYLTNNNSQLKTLSNLQSVNSNNSTTSNFVKVGLPSILPKTFEPNPLISKTFTR